MLSRTIMIAAIFAAVPSALVAQEPTAPTATAAQKGFMLVDRNGKRLGAIDAIRSDGSVTFIRDMKIYRVPLNSVTTDGRTSKTTLAWAEIRN